MSPIIMIGAGTLLLVLGTGLGLWLGNIGRGKEMARTAEVQAELDGYRRQVSEHFNTTAVHFESIGAEYRRLYDHMAAGAGALCDSRPSIFAGSIEQLVDQAIEQPVDEATDEDIVAAPPLDYDVSTDAQEELVEEELVDEPVDELVVTAEPSDEDLVETESSEELIADHEIAPESVENDKTIH